MDKQFLGLHTSRIVSLMVVFGFLASILVPGKVALAATRSVTNTGDSGPGSLRDAIATAAPGDTIAFGVVGTITLAGGELVVDKNLTIAGPGSTSLRISGNNASRIFNITGGSVEISGVTLSGGNVGPEGGSAIIVASGAALTVRASSISNNNRSSAGAINSGGTLNVFDSTFSGNVANNGAAIYAAGTVTIAGSTFVANKADINEGGAFFAAGGTWNITNSTVSNNSSVSFGGGLVTTAGAPSIPPSVTITNSTFNGNSAPFGSGIFTFSGSVTLRNTIVADSASGGNCVGVSSAGNNLSSDGSCGGTSGDLVNTDPRLVALADNGGPTLTHALPPGSPAIDKIAPDQCAVTSDQRGISRSAPCDIGAYEVGNQARETATIVNPGTTVTGQAQTTTDVNWYKLSVPKAGSIINAQLAGAEDYDLFLFAPVRAVVPRSDCQRQPLPDLRPPTATAAGGGARPVPRGDQRGGDTRHATLVFEPQARGADGSRVERRLYSAADRRSKRRLYARRPSFQHPCRRRQRQDRTGGRVVRRGQQHVMDAAGAGV